MNTSNYTPEMIEWSKSLERAQNQRLEHRLPTNEPVELLSFNELMKELSK